VRSWPRSTRCSSTHVGDQDKDRDAAAAAGVGTFVWAKDFFGW
jgi:hypothetical protein